MPLCFVSVFAAFVPPKPKSDAASKGKGKGKGKGKSSKKTVTTADIAQHLGETSTDEVRLENGLEAAARKLLSCC